MESMSLFQILTLIISTFLMISTIIGVYIKLRLDIARLQVKIESMDSEQATRDIVVLLTDKNNREIGRAHV